LRLWTRIAIGGAACGIGLIGPVGCDHTTGPPLSAELEQVETVPTRDEANARSLCCCRVVGIVHNTSSIEAHASLRFAVTDVTGRDIGTAIDFVPNIPAGDRRAFSAAGIFVPCNRVGALEPDVLVIGLYHDDFEVAD
jgi:hypothetical protein